MGTKSKSDISNSAIRMLLQEAGSFYDESRGFKKFSVNNSEWQKVLNLFSNSCCYCGMQLNSGNATRDHLVPINKTSLGLHAWGNIVPCCQQCNKEKHFGDWKLFVKSKNDNSTYNIRLERIYEYQNKYKYDPNLSLKEIANNLYEDVGEVASVLVKLRLRQAQAVIRELLKTDRKI